MCQGEFDMCKANQFAGMEGQKKRGVKIINYGQTYASWLNETKILAQTDVKFCLKLLFFKVKQAPDLIKFEFVFYKYNQLWCHRGIKTLQRKIFLCLYEQRPP